MRPERPREVREMKPTARHEQLDGLQAGRAIAAIMVVLYHANGFVVPLRLFDGEIAWAGFGMGYAGVEFFFVLSGFIMAHVHRHEFGRPDRLARYVCKRIARIYPIYWLVLTALVVAYQLFDTLGPDVVRDPYSIFTSYLLLPSADRPVLPVAWTLKHEMLFYTIFCLMFFSFRLGIMVFKFWMAGCIIAMFYSPDGYLISFVMSPYNILFLFGIAVAMFSDKLPSRLAAASLPAGAAAFLFIGMSEQFLWSWDLAPRTLAYGFAAALLVTALARSTFAVPRTAAFLGNASYSIYLVHLPVMNICAVVLARLGAADVLTPMAACLLFTIVATLAGAGLHVLVEKPINSRLSRRTGFVAAAKSPA